MKIDITGPDLKGTQLFRIMKLVIILLTATALQVSAKGRSQGITLSLKDVTLKTAFIQIRNQAPNFDFFYDESWLKDAKKISIEVKNASLNEVLEQCFKDQPFSFTISGFIITIHPKYKSPIGSNNESFLPPIDVKGRVVNENNEPVTGVSITVKGTDKGTSTNENGEFLLKGVEEYAVLLITGINIQPIEWKVNGKENIGTLTVKTKIISEEEVLINTGYQKLKPNEMTGAISTINNQQLSRVVSTDILSRLQNVPGLLFNRFSGDAQNRNDIVIRGYSTIFSRKDPLIVLDNFPYEGDINSINPNDIENVTILKDAAASSIWGTRAANGVIVITTKTGKYNQQPLVTITNNFSIVDQPDLSYSSTLNSSDFIDLEIFLFNNGNYDDLIGSGSWPALTPLIEILINRQNGSITSSDSATQVDRLRNSDIKKDILNHYYKKLFRQQFSTTLTGGSDNQKYFLSLGADYNSNNTDNYKRISITAGNTYSFFNRKVELTTNISYSQTRSNNFPTPEGINYPYAQLADDNNNPLPIARYRQGYIDTAGGGKLLDWTYYPLKEKNNSNNHSTGINYNINIGVNVKIVKGLNADIKYQYLNQALNSENLNNLQSFYTRDLINQYTNLLESAPSLRNPVPIGGIFDKTTSNYISQNIRGQLNYSINFKRVHSLTALVGGEIGNAKTRTNSNRYYGYNEDGTSVAVDYVNSYTQYIDGGSSTILNPQTYTELNNRIVSIYSSASYAYKNKYTFYVSGRKDGNNIFGTKSNNKWKPLWSIGSSWAISKENFYNVKWLPDLRVRASYGHQGNANNSMSALLTILYSSTNKYGFNTANILNPPNPDLRWENVGQFNIGVDYSTKNNRVSGSFDYYQKRGIDIIGDMFLPPSSGIPTTRRNSANTRGEGFDIGLNLKNEFGKVTWLTNFIFSYSRDRVSNYKSNQTTILSYVQGDFTINPIVNRPISALYAYRWAGLNPSNGDPQGYLNGQISSDYSKLVRSSSLDDLVYIGPKTAPIFGSVLNTFNYKGFSISANIMYKFGYYFRRNSIEYGRVFSGVNFGHTDYLLRWKSPGDEVITNVPSLIYPNPFNSDRDLFYKYSEVLVEKGDHIKLNDIRLGYGIGHNKAHKFFRKIEVLIYASNLQIFLWRANKSNLDPDVFPINNSYMYGLPGYVLSFGVKAEF